jgi:phosphoenolpyruvate carboxykinase (diphosphate)
MEIDWQKLGDSWLVSDPEIALGWRASSGEGKSERQTQVRDYLDLKLAVLGLAAPVRSENSLWSPQLLSNLREKNRLLSSVRPAVDLRIESFLHSYFSQCDNVDALVLPSRSLTLDWHGMSRLLSLPAEGDRFSNELLTSYRVHNGALHNPKADRRTTQGTFHICEGGLAIPADKRAVPKQVFARLFEQAFHAPESLMELPYCQELSGNRTSFVSLLLRPLVCPSVRGFCNHKTMETRFFAPGGLVCNLDFVESIFGNAGDPLLPENDAGLDSQHWSGHTGCVILAPHLCRLTKRELGLPHWNEATQRQRKDRMCWQDEAELYNDGSAFKVTCRDERGVMVTLIADNYFGYCKKEVKTQISYASNLMGDSEEEHSGGALAFPSWVLGDEFNLSRTNVNGRTFSDVIRDHSQSIDVQPEGHGVDRNCQSLIYVPHDAKASLLTQSVEWTDEGGQVRSIRLEPGKVYMSPSGYKIRMDKHPAAPSWRLIGTSSEGVVCHKPCTVSGGGKSEISKSLRDYMLSGPIFVNDLHDDFRQLDEIFSRDYSSRWNSEAVDRPDYSQVTSRQVLDPRRTLGSMIKLLTPSREYTQEYNDWLQQIPSYIYAMAFIIKRFYKPEWDGNWKEYFSVDVVNGHPGHELKYKNRKLVGMYLRVGLDPENRWQIYKLRQDFSAAQKIQLEDDITASVVVPSRFLSDAGLEASEQMDWSLKFVANCEYRLFQRPDDAIYRGLDKQTEMDLSKTDNFLCNFEPLHRQQVEELIADVIHFEMYTDPMQEMLKDAVAGPSELAVSSAHPRLVDGKPSKNPRYLQDRPDLSQPHERYIASQGVRLLRGLKPESPVHFPVNSVLSGRRNNPPDPETGIRSLAVYNPIHYQELPELFMDYVCSLTGKSPSTTGAGSEGALTKGPFNALLPVHDLNAAMVSMILTGLGGFSTAAGFVGSHMQVAHDISFLVPELWCRLTAQERNPQYLIEEGLLEKLDDFEHDGQRVLASRLGYRITSQFVRRFFGRLFDNPSKVFGTAILQPETQDMEGYVDGVHHIIEAQQRVAKQYFEDGSYELAIPPLQAVLSVMAHGSWNDLPISDPEVRKLFTRETLLASPWYGARLDAKREVDRRLWSRHELYLSEYTNSDLHGEVANRMDLQSRLQDARDRLKMLDAQDYLDRIQGTLGVDPSLLPS